MVTKRETGRKKLEEGSPRSTVTAGDLGLSEKSEKNVSPACFAIAIRSLRQNWRQGTVACKDRGSLTSRSNKKPWKQKGTGRARAGSPRSPIWRGGGVSFGPQPRVHEIAINKKMRNNALNALLYEFIEKKKIVALDWQVSSDTPKTTNAYRALKDAQLSDKKLVLFVPIQDALTHASYANIPNIRILSFDQPNVYDLADGQFWVIFRKDLDQFKEMVQRWI